MSNMVSSCTKKAHDITVRRIDYLDFTSTSKGRRRPDALNLTDKIALNQTECKSKIHVVDDIRDVILIIIALCSNNFGRLH